MDRVAVTRVGTAMAVTAPRHARGPLPSARNDRLDHVLIGTPFVLISVLTFTYTPDDALITARYAFNALAGEGLVYNVGERVEGFSSPLQLALTVLLATLPGGFFLLKMKLLSIAFGLLTLLASVRLVRTVGLPRWAHVLALVAIGGSWNLAVSAANALESSLVAFLTTLLVALLVGGAGPRRPALVALVAGLLSVTRPESVLLVALAAVAVAATPGPQAVWRRLLWIAGPVVAVVVLEAARWTYFHDIAPNTFYAKREQLGEGVASAARYLWKTQPVWDGLGRAGASVSLALQAVLGAVVVMQIRRARQWELLPLVAAVFGQLVFVVASGGDWMRGGRFLAPVLPSITVLMAIGLAAAVGRIVTAGWRIAAGALVAVTAASLCWPVTSAYAPAWRTASLTDRDLVLAGRSDFDGAFNRLWVLAPETVSCLRPGQSVAYTEMGYFGFTKRQLNVVDMRGLTDAELARTATADTRNFYGIVDANWFEVDSSVGRILTERRPEMILSIDSAPQVRPLGGAYRLMRSVDFGWTNPLSVYERTDFTCRVQE